MAEEETKTDPAVEKPAEPKTKPEGEKPSDMIDRSNLASLRREEANKKTEELIERQEALEVRRNLSGKADAGQEPLKPKGLTNKEYTEYVEKYGKAPDET